MNELSQHNKSKCDLSEVSSEVSSEVLSEVLNKVSNEVLIYGQIKPKQTFYILEKSVYIILYCIFSPYSYDKILL